MIGFAPIQIQRICKPFSIGRVLRSKFCARSPRVPEEHRDYSERREGIERSRSANANFMYLPIPRFIPRKSDILSIRRNVESQTRIHLWHAE
jgi:hypothetical protein